MSAKVFLVRHGEAEWNVEGREMGHMDSPLTARGVAQSEAVAGRLARAGVDAVYASDLGRAVQTAEIIAEACGVSVHLDRGLRERNMGVFQGLTFAEIRDRQPDERRAYEADRFGYAIPGGESGRQRLERNVAALDAIADRHAEASVVVVAHGGVASGVFAHALGSEQMPAWRFGRHNGGLSVLRRDVRGWAIETWNDIGHLDRVGALDDPGSALS